MRFLNREYIIPLFLIAVFLVSCSFNSQARKQKSEWIFAFKAEACDACLKSSGASIKNDNSSWLRFEILNQKYQKIADSVGVEQAELIIKNGAYFKDGDMEGGRAITNGCLLLFKSPLLDFFAKKSNKEYIKSEE